MSWKMDFRYAEKARIAKMCSPPAGTGWFSINLSSEWGQPLQLVSRGRNKPQLLSPWLCPLIPAFRTFLIKGWLAIPSLWSPGERCQLDVGDLGYTPHSEWHVVQPWERDTSSQGLSFLVYAVTKWRFSKWQLHSGHWVLVMKDEKD